MKFSRDCRIMMPHSCKVESPADMWFSSYSLSIFVKCNNLVLLACKKCNVSFWYEFRNYVTPSNEPQNFAITIVSVRCQISLMIVNVGSLFDCQKNRRCFNSNKAMILCLAAAHASIFNTPRQTFFDLF